MFTPHHHWDETDLTVADPAQLVFVVTLRDDRGLTEIAYTSHLTVKMTDECHFTMVPGTGFDDTTLFHFVVPALGPRVEK